MKIYIVVFFLLNISAVFLDGVSSAFDSGWSTIVSNYGTVDDSANIEDSISTLSELKKNVLFYLYTTSNPKEPQQLYLEDDDVLSASNFNPNNPTRIVIHGWSSDAKEIMATGTRDAYLSAGDYNVILVDWSAYTSKDYVSARTKVVTVGEYVGLMIDFLVANGNMDIKDLIIVGHSLGAHVSGLAGRTALDNVPIIIALDPAGPLFYIVHLKARLRSTDADFIQVIHTSAGSLGHADDLGHSNIWVNGGLTQKGCGLDLVKTCAHSRSYLYFAESIINTEKQFLALRCSSYFKFTLGLCSSNKSTYLGGRNPDTSASGTYFVNTNSVSTYAMVFLDGVSSTSESSWTIIVSENGTVEIVDESTTVEDSISTLEELKEDVLFYLYTTSNPEDAQQIYFEDDDVLSASYFNSSNPTRIVIHGWLSGVNKTMPTLIREAYLSVGEYNVIVVDWTAYTNKDYVTARTKIVAVGEYVGLLIDFLVAIGNMSIADLIIIGHSLGAHVSGVAGRSAIDTVPIIIALDPAGPLFYIVDSYARLRSTDADFVQMIHTSAGWLGHKEDLGDSNIWVNGGSKQNGCGLDLFRTCAHSRSYYYIAESITNTETQFLAYSCESYSDYTAGNCASNNSTYLGGHYPDTTAFGKYFVDTNSASIYAMG